ncbi:MAG: hypothetical protein Q7K42_06195, partial [Candidatus Diapherotrites archaeon]|nr:hypothetical protein [Candidatus Diapherotrites archaeon]
MELRKTALKRIVREAKAHVSVRSFFEQGKFSGQSTRILRKVLGETKQDRQNISTKMSRKQRLGIAKTSLNWSRKIRAVKAAVEKYGFEKGKKTPDKL